MALTVFHLSMSKMAATFLLLQADNQISAASWSKPNFYYIIDPRLVTGVCYQFLVRHKKKLEYQIYFATEGLLSHPPPIWLLFWYRLTTSHCSRPRNYHRGQLILPFPPFTTRKIVSIPRCSLIVSCRIVVYCLYNQGLVMLTKNSTQWRICHSMTFPQPIVAPPISLIILAR